VNQNVIQSDKVDTKYIYLLSAARLREGLKVVLNISKYGNQYMQANKPWVLVKGNENER